MKEKHTITQDVFEHLTESIQDYLNIYSQGKLHHTDLSSEDLERISKLACSISDLLSSPETLHRSSEQAL